MDFMKLLKSIEELLYELITWFVFYPLTFWRIVTRPIAMLTYAQQELTEKDEEQFDDAVSPPILLLLTLVILHVLEAVFSRETATLPVLLQDDRNLLVFRALAFSLFPLLFATLRLRMTGARLTRTTLKPAFYSQSYAAVPLVLAFSAGMQLLSVSDLLAGGWVWGTGLMLVGTLWYLAVETVWFSHNHQMSRLRAFFMTLGIFLGAIIVLFLVVVAVAVATTELGESLPLVTPSAEGSSTLPPAPGT